MIPPTSSLKLPVYSRVQTAQPRSPTKTSSLSPVKADVTLSSWRPPLQRTKRFSRLPSIDVSGPSKPELIYCEERTEDDETGIRPIAIRAASSLQSKRPILRGSSISTSKNSPYLERFEVPKPQSIRRKLTSARSFPSYGSSGSFELPDQKVSIIDHFLGDTNSSYKSVPQITLVEYKNATEPQQKRLNSARPDVQAMPLSRVMSASGYLNNSRIKANPVMSNVYPFSRTHPLPISKNSVLSSQRSPEYYHAKGLTKSQPTAVEQVDTVELGELAQDDICVSGETVTVNSRFGLRSLEKCMCLPDVSCVVISKVDFAYVTLFLCKLQLCKNLLTLVLYETQIHTFNQLEALVQVRNLQHLVVGEINNPIVDLSTWSLYLVHRMGHLALSTINGKQISTDMHQAALQVFGPVVQLARAAHQRRRHYVHHSESVTQQTLLQEKQESSSADDDACRTPRPLVAVTNVDKQVVSSGREAARQCVEEALANSNKLLQLQRLARTIWPVVLADIVSQAIADFNDINGHMRTCMKEL